jgi:RimJ/RimL family protein N-acetyltransferase
MTPGGSPDGMQYDDSDMEDWFDRYVDGQSVATHFMICLNGPSEEPIGELYIAGDDRPGCVNLALLIGETGMWGNRYGSEALVSYCDALFDSGFCDAVRVDVRLDNHRAVRMCQNAGFQVEHLWANGMFQTMILTREARELKRFWAENE